MPCMQTMFIPSLGLNCKWIFDKVLYCSCIILNASQEAIICFHTFNCSDSVCRNREKDVEYEIPAMIPIELPLAAEKVFVLRCCSLTLHVWALHTTCTLKGILGRRLLSLIVPFSETICCKSGTPIYSRSAAEWRFAHTFVVFKKYEFSTLLSPCEDFLDYMYWYIYSVLHLFLDNRPSQLSPALRRLKPFSLKLSFWHLVKPLRIRSNALLAVSAMFYAFQTEILSILWHLNVLYFCTFLKVLVGQLGLPIVVRSA